MEAEEHNNYPEDFSKAMNQLEDQELRTFYYDLVIALVSEGNPNWFLHEFNLLKEKLLYDPNKIKIYINNTNKYHSLRGVISLIYQFKILERNFKEKDDKFIGDLPETFNKEWADFSYKYKDQLITEARPVIDDFVSRIDEILVEHDGQNGYYDPEMMDACFIVDLIFDEGSQIDKNDINYVKEKILKHNFPDIISRWNQIPTLKLSNSIKNKKALFGIFREINSSYAIGNNHTVIALCRKAMEHVLYNYYGGRELVSVGFEPKLVDMIDNAAKTHNSVNPSLLHKQRKTMNRIIHSSDGNPPTDKNALHNIYFVRNLIENAP